MLPYYSWWTLAMSPARSRSARRAPSCIGSPFGLSGRRLVDEVGDGRLQCRDRLLVQAADAIEDQLAQDRQGLAR